MAAGGDEAERRRAWNGGAVWIGAMSHRKRTLVIGSIAIVLVLAGGYVALCWLASSWVVPSETTDVGTYGAVLKQWGGSGLVRQFPGSIPPQARGVRLAAMGGYLQGGAYIQLRMRLPASEVAAIEAGVKQAATHVYHGGGFFDHVNEDSGKNVPTAPFRTADRPETTVGFPPRYTLYVLSAKDLGGRWNHGETSGVGVSRADGEVVYWAESW